MKQLLVLLLMLALFGCTPNNEVAIGGSATVNWVDKYAFNTPTESVEETVDTDINDEGNNDIAQDEETASSSNGSNNGGNQNNPQPESEPDPQPVIDSDTQSQSEPPKQACPNGKYPDKPCDYIADNNYYYKTFSTESEANAEGQKMMNEVEYLNGLEITSYSVQAVYRNDGSIAHYGLNLWSDGKLIK